MAFPLATGDMGSNGGLFGKLEGVTWLLDVDEDMVHSGSVLEIWLGGLQHTIYSGVPPYI